MKLVQVAVIFACAVGVLTAQKVFEVGNGVSAPTVIKRVNAQYTPEAKRAHLEGIVGLHVVVGPDGSVREVAVTRSLDSLLGLDQQAMKAMRQWRFRPGSKDGKPVAVSIDMEMNFSLK